MKKLGVLLLMATFILTGVSIIQAQDINTDQHHIFITIPDIALLDIEATGDKDISLSPTAPTEAGLPLVFTNISNNLLWLNYSSLAPSGTSRKVTVTLSEVIPSGMTMELTASAPTLTGGGDKGSSATGSLLPTTTGSDLVTSIGSCYTGNGVSNGVNLNYDLDIDVDNYADLVADEANPVDIIVTYTLVDE